MLAYVWSPAVRGVDSYLVRVEVNLASGLPSFSVVGLPDGAVREGRDRVLAAMGNSGFAIPHQKITVNLAPADVRKEGSAFDLPIAIGLLVVTGKIPEDALDGYAAVGELGLDGGLRPVRGAVAMAAGARAGGRRALLVPSHNAPEAAVLDGVDIIGVHSLSEACAHLRGERVLRPVQVDLSSALAPGPDAALDLSDVQGQEHAKRALEVAAAGGHNLLLIGPPGSGKTMLAQRLPGILPALSADEALEVTTVHSVAGRVRPGATVLSTRPFRAPHHTVSAAGLVGGGTPPRPGEASLAHNGVLFLDEVPEFRRGALEVLRQPLEDGWVALSRARYSVRFPARFTLVAAMNPCPCGYHGDGTGRCLCEPIQVARYRARVSGPLLDRIDLHVHVPAVDVGALSSDPPAPASQRVRERVDDARSRQRRRFVDRGRVFANGQMGLGDVRRCCRLGEEDGLRLEEAMTRLGLSARGYHRILKVARTLADLDGSEVLSSAHLGEAIQYRALDRARVL